MFLSNTKYSNFQYLTIWPLETSIRVVGEKCRDLIIPLISQVKISNVDDQRKEDEMKIIEKLCKEYFPTQMQLSVENFGKHALFQFFYQRNEIFRKAKKYHSIDLGKIAKDFDYCYCFLFYLMRNCYSHFNEFKEFGGNEI